ncbi:N-6 DNA methylase [Actinospica robiniae]|uniref:N-6 DNA methylase n=1 Tax=Actinospica robiniae TaxID=304901 RepID=UPI0004248BAE|nr:N-6 DNA methylase [Actinospica robiniae]
MTDHTEVTAAQIARIAGVGRAAVSNWRKRHADFPAPVGGSETSPTFSLRAVEDWLRAEGKLSETPADELLWRAVDAAGGTADATRAVLTGLGRALAGAPSSPAEQTLDPELVAQASKLAEADGRGEVFERLQDRYVTTYMRNRDAGNVGEPLARLMAGLSAPPRASASSPPAHVYDPCCGIGSLLAAAARQGSTSLTGQAAEPNLVPLATTRLMLLADGLDIDIQPGDALLADTHAGLAADAVLCQPPTAQREWGFDDLSYDPRWEYGMPPRAEPELAWVQHALARLRPGGIAVVLLPPGVAVRRPGRRIRAELLRRGALRGVIGLPAAWAAPYGAPPHIWILRRPDLASPAPNRLLFIDQSAPVDVAALGDTVERIVEAWHAFEHSPDTAAVEPGFSAVLPVIELLDDLVDLSPGRHVPHPETGLGRVDLLASRATVQSVLAQLGALLPELGPDPSPSLPWPMTTLGDLARTQALEILAEAAIAPGDVLVPVLGGAMGQAVVVGDGDPLVGTATGRGTVALRTDKGVLDPWFVAGFLRSDAAARQAVSHASSTSRMDIRKAPLPRLPLSRQRSYAAAFQRIVEFSDSLRLVADLGERFAREITNALVEGTALPAE